MEDFREYENRIYNFRKFRSDSPEGKVYNFISKSEEKVLTASQIRMNCYKLSKVNYPKAKKVLEENRVLFSMPAEKLFSFYKNTLLLDAIDTVFIEKIKNKNPRQEIIINSHPFLKIPYSGIDKIDFTLWDMYFDKLKEVRNDEKS